MNKSKLLKVSALAFVLSLSAGLCSAFIETKVSANTPAPTSEIIGKNLSLDDNIYVLYAVNFQNTLETDETGVLVWTAPQETYDYQTANAVLYSTGTMTDDSVTYPTFSYNKLSAKQMTEVIFASSYVERDGVYYYGEVEKYSILEYAYNKLGKTEKTETDDEDLKTLLTAMLNYGAASQIYKDYNLDKLATDNYVHVRIENATFEDGFNYGLFEAGDEVKFTVNEGYTIDTSLTDYITKNENGEYILTVPSEKTEFPTKPQEHIHDWSEWTVVSEETCTTSGLEMRICQTDASHSEQRFIQPKHILIDHVAQAPTCSEVGWESYQTCSRCDYTTYVEIETIDHSWYVWETFYPTCFDSGYDLLFCENCNESKRENYTAPLEHNYNCLLYRVDPTCTEYGSECYGCSICCGADIQIDLEPLGHNWVTTGTWFPTCTMEGWDDLKCSICGEFGSDNYVAPLGHNYVNGICTVCQVFQECLEYTLLDNDTYAVSGIGTYTDTNLIIPSTYNEKAVTSIDNEAFDGCSNLTSVTIPNSVTDIRFAAFRACSNLTSVVIPDSVTWIGDSAFMACSGLTSVVIPDSVTLIEWWAFAGCSSLTSIVIPDSVAYIYFDAFSNCSNLTIYCESTNKPNGWESTWNSSNRPVYWYSENEPTLNSNFTGYDGNYWRYVDGIATPWVYVNEE